MNVLVIDRYTLIRLCIFLGVFVILGIWEACLPRRVLRTPKTVRWFTNLSLTLVNSLMLRLLLPLPVVALAVFAQAKSWGLFHLLHMPSLLVGAISLLLLDVTIYLQHLIFHKVPVLWYVHAMHHTDLDIDVTTGVRFHPIEIVLSLLIKMGVTLAFGISPVILVAFEVLLNATSMFNHANSALSPKIDWTLRLVLVTPDMHRVHHSVIIGERNRNFGFNLSWWDRLFGTYKEKPEAGHESMVIGLANFRNPSSLSLPALILLPLSAWGRL
ncbi:MAG TPA: sterol desaturase family protein [Syntrophorhabdaceae bacterium]|nr:sterol desaturase family protein [Syntrophorhabdaceae bacterium]